MSDRQAAQSRSGGHTSAGFRVSGPMLQTNFPRLSGRPVDYEAVKARAFHDQNIAVIDLNDSRIAWPDREIIVQACRKLYGQK